ncbi:MAG TPA: aldo/keto reductase, partial [Chloroflexota bacterium]|nr:aldo/keto reductase [Chloroflexota bacterium]
GQYQETVDKHLPELQQCQRDGLTRFLGVTELYERDSSHDMIRRLLADGLFDVFMIGHNMLTPTALPELFPEAQRKNIGVVVMCAVRTVISTPDMLRDHIREWKAEGALPKDAVPDDKPLDWVLGGEAKTITDAAYKFAAESPAVGSVLTGTASEEHLLENIRAILGAPLPREVSKRLEDTFTPVNRSVQARIGAPNRR